MSLHCSQLLCFFTTFFKFLNFLISDRWKIEVPCVSMRSAGVLPYSEPGQLNSNLHAIWKFNTLLLLRVEGPFGMEYFHGKSKGNKNRGKFYENSVWIKGFSGSFPMEHCCRLLVSKEKKNPIRTQVFSSFTKYETTTLLRHWLA